MRVRRRLRLTTQKRSHHENPRADQMRQAFPLLRVQQRVNLLKCANQRVADALVAFDAALAKWFAITDKATQDRMYQFAADLPAKPYPAVEGVKNTLAIYDSPQMRKYKAEDFYDAGFMTALDRSGAIDRLYK